MENNNIKTIHDFDLNIICEFFLNFKRQGPGSPGMTIKALSFIDNLTENSKIADLGCGTGGQTITLAKNAPGNIVGMDIFSAFIDKFNAAAHAENLQDRVNGVVGSMDNLPFADGEMDLIWSEGAIYNIGFERGLNEWRRYIKPGGYVAVTEATWFTDERPAEIHDFWMDAYPEIDTIPNKVAVLQNAGYIPTAVFILPSNNWTEYFYADHDEAARLFHDKYAGNVMAEELVANQSHEMELYNKYKDYYGYVFYIGKKI